MISYDMDPYYHTLWDTKTGEKPFDVRTLTLRSFLSMVRKRFCTNKEMRFFEPLAALYEPPLYNSLIRSMKIIHSMSHTPSLDRNVA